MGEALLLLGYNVVGARLDFSDELLNGNVDGVLREAIKFDAFQDVPWAPLYRELDIQFPGSKFILIERDGQKWLQSAVRHFGDRHIKMHSWMYGQGNIIGNENLYLQRYQQHNKEVKEYFEDRPNDLLVISLENGDGWEKLCPFLDKDIPKKKFPFANKARENYSLAEMVTAYLKGKISVEMRRKILDALGVKDRRNRFNNHGKNIQY